MILIAVIIYVLMNLIPSWILKDKYKQLENRFSWKIPILKLTGLAMSILIAFMLIFGITKSTRDTFIENKNAIYGLEFNKEMKEFGFQDGMRIKSINGREIDRVSDIIKLIILEDGETQVLLEKDGVNKEIVLNNRDKLTLIQHSSHNIIEPIFRDGDGNNKIKVTIKNYSFLDALNKFGIVWKQAMVLINPTPSAYTSIGGFIVISKINSIQGFLMILSLNLILLGIINLLPLPGFSMGNFGISLVETLRKKNYDRKKKRIVGLITILLIIVFLGIRIYK